MTKLVDCVVTFRAHGSRPLLSALDGARQSGARCFPRSALPWGSRGRAAANFVGGARGAAIGLLFLERGMLGTRCGEGEACIAVNLADEATYRECVTH